VPRHHQVLHADRASQMFEVFVLGWLQLHKVLSDRGFKKESEPQVTLCCQTFYEERRIKEH
jgi:hypothetical protein